MANDMNKFQELFEGEWKWDRDENLEGAMKEMGCPEDEIKMFTGCKPIITFKREGDSSIFMNYELVPGMGHSCTYKFNEEFDSKDELSRDNLTFFNKETATLTEDGVMQWVSKNQLKGPGKIDTFSEWFVKDGELHTPSCSLSDRSTCKSNRIFKKVQK